MLTAKNETQAFDLQQNAPTTELSLGDSQVTFPTQQTMASKI